MIDGFEWHKGRAIALELQRCKQVVLAIEDADIALLSYAPVGELRLGRDSFATDRGKDHKLMRRRLDWRGDRETRTG